MRSRVSRFRLLALGVIVIAMIAGSTAAGAAPEWTISTTPRPADSRFGQNTLAGVSCVSRTNCFAVGRYVNSSGALRTLIEHWNGSSWRVVASPNVGTAGGSLSGVSCSGPASCFAVGMTNGNGISRTLIERLNGSSWTVVASPATGSVILTSVSCATAKSCFAVGNYVTSARTFIERWDGASWTIVASPSPASVDTQLNGVSCASPKSCFAVGNFTASHAPHSLIERWDGSRWSIVHSATPVGSISTLLFGVACANAKACFAVGAWFTQTAARTLIERWDGTSWVIVFSPNPDDGENELRGVSCVNRDTCTAVGSRVTSAPGRGRTLVVAWSGTRWRGVPSPTPGVAASGQLSGVSCAVATSCFAVGEYQQDGLQHMLTERHSLHAGYWMVDANGHLYPFGDAGVATPPFPGHPVAIAAVEIGHEQAYWIAAANGHVQAGLRGSAFPPPALSLGETITSISGTPSGHGYWLFTNAGRAIPFGDAHFYGDMHNVALSGPIVASAATPTGHGYYMVGSDGGVFTFGDARFRGSTGSMNLSRPVVGIAPTPDNRGYWLVASDGGVFSFNAPFRGSMGATPLNKPVVGMVAYGNGYLMVASDGGIFAFSDKPFAGSLGSHPPNAPVVGVAAFVD